MSKCNNIIDFNAYVNKINKKKHISHVQALAEICHNFVDGIEQYNESGEISDVVARETLTLTADLLFKVLMERAKGGNWLKL